MSAIEETYAAALQHDLVDLPPETAKIGVVRRPTGWFRALVDENIRELGPPESLLSRTKDRQEDLQQRGLCEEEAHNAAWDEVGFASQYREYLDSDDDAKRAVSDLVERVSAGETVALVCFEGETKRCHRHLLREELRDQVEIESGT